MDLTELTVKCPTFYMIYEHYTVCTLHGIYTVQCTLYSVKSKLPDSCLNVFMWAYSTVSYMDVPWAQLPWNLAISFSSTGHLIIYTTEH